MSRWGRMAQKAMVGSLVLETEPGFAQDPRNRGGNAGHVPRLLRWDNASHLLPNSSSASSPKRQGWEEEARNWGRGEGACSSFWVYEERNEGLGEEALLSLLQL